MNIKTTILLFVLVIAVGATIVALERKAPRATPTLPPADTTPEQRVEKKLLDEKFGEPTDIVVQVEGQPPWRFERKKAEAASPTPGAEEEWTMVAPYVGKVQRWQVEQIGSSLKRATYAVKYAEGTGSGMSLAEAGLEPPRATITLTDGSGAKVEVRVGRHEGNDETYVSVGQNKDIYLIKPSLRSALKKRALEYLDQQLFNVKADRVVRMEVTETPEQGDPETHVLVKSGTDWVFEAPTKAKAVNENVRKVVNALGTLRVTNWTTENAESLALYGLDRPAVTVKFTVENPAEPPAAQPGEENDNGPEAKPAETPQPTIATYTVRFSRIHPLNEDTKVFVARGDENLVGTLLQTTADTFKPNLKEWRNNRIVERDLAAASRIEWTVGGVAAVLSRSGPDWIFDGAGEPADRVEVADFLRKVGGLSATNFVAAASSVPAEFGFESPRAVLTLGFANQPPLRILVGGFADPKTQRLVYVQVADSDTVAKVPVKEAELLLGSAAGFRDRTVADVPPDRLSTIVVDRLADGAPRPDTRQTFTLGKEGDKWRMTSPIGSDVDAQQMDKLTKTLGTLRAIKVVDGPGGLADFGLDRPEIVVSYTYLPPPIVRMEQAPPTEEESAAGEPATQPAKLVPKSEQPPPATRTLSLARKDNRVFALRDDKPDTVFEIGESIFNDLRVELRSTELWKFEAAQATGLTLREGADSQGFRKVGTKWTYSPEDDIPIDDKKVQDYLTQLAGLKLTRYVDYQAADLAVYGLASPQYELTVEVPNKPLPALAVSAMTAPDGGRYARLAGSDAVFIVPPEVAAKLAIKIADFEKAAP